MWLFNAQKVTTEGGNLHLGQLATEVAMSLLSSEPRQGDPLVRADPTWATIAGLSLPYRADRRVLGVLQADLCTNLCAARGGWDAVEDVSAPGAFPIAADTSLGCSGSA